MMKLYKQTIYIFFSIFSFLIILTTVFNYKIDSVGVFDKENNELEKITQRQFEK